MNSKAVKKSIFQFLLCILIGSCAKSKLSTDISIIPVKDRVGKYEILNISDYASSITYIPLETNENVLIHEIGQIVYEREKIILHNALSANTLCMVFNSEGHYLYNLGRQGLGPEEYLSIRNIDTYNDLIFLHTASPVKIRIYNLGGHLIDILRVDGIPEKYHLSNIWFLRHQFFLADVVTMSPANSISSYPRAILLQEENKRLLPYKEYPYEHLEKEISGFSGNFEVAIMYRFNDQIRTYKIINDTIFTVGRDLEMDKAFIFDLGKYRASTKWMFAIDNNKNPIYIWPLNIMESSNYLFIEFTFGNHAPERFEYIKRWSDGTERIWTDYRVFGLFDKRIGKLKLMNQPVKQKLGFKNDLDNGPVIWPNYITTNDELVSFIHPEEFMEYYDIITNPTAELMEIANKIVMDDNPIVIITQLK